MNISRFSSKVDKVVKCDQKDDDSNYNDVPFWKMIFKVSSRIVHEVTKKVGGKIKFTISLTALYFVEIVDFW